MSYYLPIAGGRIIGFIPFPRVLVLCEMQSASSTIWTRVAVFISYDGNHYTKGTFLYTFYIQMPLLLPAFEKVKLYFHFIFTKISKAKFMQGHSNNLKFVFFLQQLNQETYLVCVCLCVFTLIHSWLLLFSKWQNYFRASCIYSMHSFA